MRERAVSPEDRARFFDAIDKAAEARRGDPVKEWEWVCRDRSSSIYGPLKFAGDRVAQELSALRERAYVLAVLSLQSARYQEDPEFRDAVGAVLARTSARDVLLDHGGEHA